MKHLAVFPGAAGQRPRTHLGAGPATAGRSLGVSDDDGLSVLRRQTMVVPRDGAGSTEPVAFHGMYGRAPVMRDLFRRIVRVAGVDVPVLICGEGGTGKTMAARAIHASSERRDRPFIVIRGPSWTAEPVETPSRDSALATAWSAAEGGTLFLDELGDLPAAAQTRLLRLLEQREGSASSSRQVRLLAASSRSLEDLVTDGQLREDLFYRLRVVSLSVPSLRERAADLPLLNTHFLAVAAARHRLPVRRLDDAAYALLLQHDWPGNVRELRHVIEGALVLSEGTHITLRDLPAALTTRADATITTSVVAAQEADLSFVEARERAMCAFDRAFLGAALARHGGNVARTARALGLHRQSLQKLINRRALRADSDDQTTRTQGTRWPAC